MDGDMREWTTYQLVSFLHSKGWRCEVCHFRKDSRQGKALEDVKVLQTLEPPPAQRVYYLAHTAKTFCFSYVLLLAMCHDSKLRQMLHQQGTKSIPHLLTVKAYDHLAQPDAEVDRTSGRDTHASAVQDDMGLLGSQSSQQRPPPHTHGRSFILAESFQWGAVKFKYHSRHGAYQCDCPRRSHMTRNQGQRRPTVCSLTLKPRSVGDMPLTIRRLKWWATLCWDYARGSQHKRAKHDVVNAAPEAVPDDEELESRRTHSC